MSLVRKAFVLAGGVGVRLRPITYEIPKPLLPIQGKPMMQYALEQLLASGVQHIVISLGYRGQQISDYFGDGSRWGGRFDYVCEDEPLGTAGPLRLAESWLDETFFMISGDILCQIDLQAFAAFHQTQGGEATIAVTAVKDPSRFGLILMEDTRIIQFIEKPKSGSPTIHQINTVNSAYYVIEPELIGRVPLAQCMMEREIFPQLAAEHKLYGYRFDGQWFDVGTLKAYEQAILEWRGEQAPGR